jgi:hypothetical protein
MVPHRILLACVLMATIAAAATAQDIGIEDIPSVTTLPLDRLRSKIVVFNDYRDDKLADPGSGLISFELWERSRPGQKQLLSLYPGYREPIVKIANVGSTQKQKLHMYVAESRLVLDRASGSIDLGRYVSLSFLESLDPALKHRRLAASNVIPARIAAFGFNRHPERPWCRNQGATLCIQSTYEFDTAFSAAIRLANKMREADQQISEQMEFQSELRVVSPTEAELLEFSKLTALNAAVTGVLEQNFFWFNQIMVFGKFLAILQPHPTRPSSTVATAFLAFAIKSDVLDSMKEYDGVPILRNLVPAQVLAGRSSFNTGQSIGAGLPVYARNRLKMIGSALEREQR